MNRESFATGADYDVPLLRLLYKLPGGQGKTAEVCRIFEEEYRHRIPEEHRGELRSTGDPIWYNNVCWGRAHLKDHSFLDMPRRGVWRITEAGRQWVEEHPHETHIKGVPRRTSAKRRKRSSRRAPSLPGITLDMLEQTRKTMPADQFRQVWGVLYDQLLTEERAKAITSITQTELGRRARRRLDEIHAFLQGEIANTPSSEMLCDWIHFCYALELYREAAALLPYVREDEVDAAIYKRAKRIASVCQSKQAGA